ncbi:ABC transporter substrate-binding protein [Shigella flexneri]
MNNQKAPFTDVRVRTALKLALDRDIIVNKVKNQGDLPLTAIRRLTPTAGNWLNLNGLNGPGKT